MSPETKKKRFKYRKQWAQDNREHLRAYNVPLQIEYRAERKRIVLEHYGNKCACCGETTPQFLTIDHIKNDGRSHRKKTGSGSAFYTWLIKNKLPDNLDLQVLCWNCNMAKAHYRYCPHNK